MTGEGGFAEDDVIFFTTIFGLIFVRFTINLDKSESEFHKYKIFINVQY